jgi:glutathione S-transferase
MLELHHNDMSTCSQKIRLTLAEKALEWTGHHLSLREGDQHKPDYLRLHPGGVVPTLIHNGIAIRESTIINEYLDDAFPEVPVRPKLPVDHWRMRLLTKQLDEGVHAATGVISNCTAFRFQFAQYTAEELQAHIDRIPDPVRRETRRQIIDKGLDAPVFAPAIKRFDTLFNDLEDALAEGPWLAGEDYSLADIAYTPYLTRFDHLQYLGMLDHRPRLMDWYDRVRARPSYDVALTKWFNDKYLPLMREKGAEAWPRVKEILGSR